MQTNFGPKYTTSQINFVTTQIGFASQIIIYCSIYHFPHPQADEFVSFFYS